MALEALSILEVAGLLGFCGRLPDAASALGQSQTGSSLISNGIIKTLAGEGGGCKRETNDVGDGCLASSADLDRPTGVAVDAGGDIYVADSGNRRIRVLKRGGKGQTESFPLGEKTRF